jgi:heterodisulfide reductase subunit B
MFRASTCPSSGGQIVLSQHQVSSLSVNGCTVCRMRANCSQPAYCSVQRVTIPDAVIIQFVLLKMGMFMHETCRGFNVTYILLMNKGIVH